MGVKLHFQTTGTVPGNGAPVPMTGPSLTIGRGAENDVCLPDPGKVISKTHCTIEERGGDIVVTDLSTNGTFLNYGKMPLGPVPTPLNDGDILTLGSYELMVEILRGGAAAGGLMAPADVPGARMLPDDPSLDDLLGGDPASGAGDDDFLDDLLGGATPPRGPGAVNRPEPGDDGLLPPLGEDDDDLLGDPKEETAGGAAQEQHSNAMSDSFTPARPLIPDDWGDEDLLLGDGGTPDDPFPPLPDESPDPIPEELPEPPPEPIEEPPAETPPARPPELPPETPPERPPENARPATTPAPAGGTDSARAFLAALGADDVNIPDADLPATMARLGGVMQVMVHGLREILMTRASIKSEFRIQQTLIASGNNNPLKFSISPEQAVETMVRPDAKGYLPADAAAKQALDDIKAHEIAMMTAMEAAVKGILKQLSPDVVEDQITGGGGIAGLLQGKKARYWDVYETMYAKIADQAETDFHELFSREFARAYQAQMERLK